MLSTLKFVLRSLFKTPGLTSVIVLTLALGIGANTAIFSMVKAVFLNPVPYPEPEQLVYLWEKAPNFDMAAIAWPDLEDWRKENRSFSALGGFRRESYRFTDSRGPRTIAGIQANAALFVAQRSPPLLGRVFTESEDKVGAPGLLLLSHSFWQRHFNGDPAAIGRTMDLNGVSYTVIGVLRSEEELRYPEVDLWTQLGRVTDKPAFQARGNHPGIFAVGRMKPGVTLRQAMADLENISARILKQHP